MQIVPIESAWRELIDPSWVDDLDRTPFLARCRDRVATRDELHAFVRQQYFYARHFTRFLCGLMARIEDESDRRDLTQNLFEEMGLGDMGAVPHTQMYREMMDAMGVAIEHTAPTAATDALVATMFECCTSPRAMVGFGALCLGAEAIVPHVYSTILRGFDGVGEAPERLEFFRVHVAGDDAHAVTMRRIILRTLERDPSTARDLRDGASRAILARAAFFRAIEAPSARPVARAASGCRAPGAAAMALRADDPRG